MTSSDISSSTERAAPDARLAASAPGRRYAHRPVPVPLLVTLAYLTLSCWIFRAGWRHPGEITYGGNDAYLFSWFLRWTPHALADGLDPFVTHRINAPDGANALWSTPVPLLGLIAAPITALGGPVTTLTVLLTLAPVASGLALFLVLRRWVRDAPAALAGLLYGFGPYLVGASYGHLHLAFVPFPPILLLLLDDLVVRGRPPRRTGVLLGLAVAGQALIGEEVLATSALAAGIGLAVLAIRHRDEVRARVGPALRGLATAALVALVLLAWPLCAQFLGDQRVHGSIQPSGVAVSDLWTFLTPTPLQRLAPDAALRHSLRFTGNAVEVSGYLGLPLVLLALAGAIGARRHPLVRVLAPLGLAMAVLSLGDHLHVGGRATGIPLPWLAVEQVPILRNALPSRLALYVMLCTAAITAIALNGLATRLAAWRTDRPAGRTAAGRARAGALLLTAGLLTAGALATLVPAPLLTTPARTPGFFTGDGVRQIPAGALALVVPYPRPQRAEAMLWQAQADFRFAMPGCYCTVPGPDGRAVFHGPGDALTTALIEVDEGATTAAAASGSTRVRQAFTRLSPDAVVLGPSHRSDELRTLLVALVGCPPRRVDGVDLWLPDRCR